MTSEKKAQKGQPSHKFGLLVGRGNFVRSAHSKDINAAFVQPVYITSLSQKIPNNPNFLPSPQLDCLINF